MKFPFFKNKKLPPQYAIDLFLSVCPELMKTLEYRGESFVYNNGYVSLWRHKDGIIASGDSGYNDFFMWHKKKLYTVDDLRYRIRRYQIRHGKYC